MAKELAVDDSSAPLLMDRIRPRVRAKYSDDGVVPEYLDENGGATVYNRAEFMKKIASDPSCARVVKGSDASGGGHQGATATSTSVAPQGGKQVQGKIGGTQEERRAYFEAKYGDKLKPK
jgi:hypothetical protein